MKTLERIKSCPNFRDLGGISCKGGYTREGKIFRSDCLSRLNSSEILTLSEMGIQCIIDLRTDIERQSRPNPLENHPAFNYYNVSLFNGIKSKDYVHHPAESLPVMYRDLLDEAGFYIGQVFKIMTRHENDSIVIHCAAGKDRTGVICALLLKLAGVDDGLVIENYSRSYALMKDVFKAEMNSAGQYAPCTNNALYYSNAIYMYEFLKYLNLRYFSVKRYLLKFLTANELNTLENMIVPYSVAGQTIPSFLSF